MIIGGKLGAKKGGEKSRVHRLGKRGEGRTYLRGGKLHKLPLVLDRDLHRSIGCLRISIGSTSQRLDGVSPHIKFLLEPGHKLSIVTDEAAKVVAARGDLKRQISVGKRSCSKSFMMRQDNKHTLLRLREVPKVSAQVLEAMKRLKDP